MYSTYIREFDKNVALLEEQSKRNPAFGAVVRGFEVGGPSPFPLFPAPSWLSYCPLGLYVARYLPPVIVCLCVCVCVCVSLSTLGQSPLCEPGSKALPTETRAKDSPVSTAAHRYLRGTILMYLSISGKLKVKSYYNRMSRTYYNVCVIIIFNYKGVTWPSSGQSNKVILVLQRFLKCSPKIWWHNKLYPNQD